MKEIDFDAEARSFAGLITNTPGCTTKACNLFEKILRKQFVV